MKKGLWIIALCFTLTANSQIIEPIKWSFSSTVEGVNAELTFKAVMDKGWHLYDTELPGDGPIPTSFVYGDSTMFTFVGELQKFL